jgi:hypothetical protein
MQIDYSIHKFQLAAFPNPFASEVKLTFYQPDPDNDVDYVYI